VIAIPNICAHPNDKMTDDKMLLLIFSSCHLVIGMRIFGGCYRV